MPPDTPLLVEGSIAAVALLTVASFTKLYAMDKKFGEMLVLLTHDDVGLLGRMKRVEGRQRRHSDALKAMGADLEE